MKKAGLFLLSLLVLALLLPFISADVLSINSGGDGDLIISPSEEIEGFFFGEEEAEEAPPEEEEPPAGGGGGGVTQNIAVSPTEFNVNLAINTNVERIINVTNIGSTAVTIDVSQQNLDGRAILNVSSLTLNPGETKQVGVVFVATSEVGIFTGTIIVDDVTIPVSLNVKTKLLLFDSNIIVLNENYQVPQGNRLRTQVTLIPMGDPDRLDVTLYYVIKDYKGKTYLTRSETVLVEEKIDFNRNFGTGSLPVGEYIVGLELVYPNGVAPSSAHFEVVEKGPVSIFGKIVLFLIILILIVLIILIIVWIKRERDKKKQGQVAMS